MRLIDADALLQRAIPHGFSTPKWVSDIMIDDAPTIDPMKHGKWESKMLDKFRKYEVTCSECGAKYIGNYDAYDEPCDFGYCPNCGAKME